MPSAEYMGWQLVWSELLEMESAQINKALVGGR